MEDGILEKAAAPPRSGSAATASPGVTATTFAASGSPSRVAARAIASVAAGPGRDDRGVPDALEDADRRSPPRHQARRTARASCSATWATAAGTRRGSLGGTWPDQERIDLFPTETRRGRHACGLAPGTSRCAPDRAGCRRGCRRVRGRRRARCRARRPRVLRTRRLGCDRRSASSSALGHTAVVAPGTPHATDAMARAATRLGEPLAANVVAVTPGDAVAADPDAVGRQPPRGGRLHAGRRC